MPSLVIELDKITMKKSRTKYQEIIFYFVSWYFVGWPFVTLDNFGCRAFVYCISKPKHSKPQIGHMDSLLPNCIWRAPI